MSSMISCERLEEDVRNTALEFLISLAEAKPALARRIPNFTISLLHSLLKMMTLTDNDNWNLGEKQDIDDEQSTLGEESLDLDRLALSLGGNTLAPILFTTLPQLLSNSEWRQRYSGLNLRLKKNTTLTSLNLGDSEQ